MNRRGFLGLFAGAAGAAVLDPERLLWVPWRKTISIPKDLRFAGMKVVVDPNMPRDQILLFSEQVIPAMLEVLRPKLAAYMDHEVKMRQFFLKASRASSVAPTLTPFSERPS